MKLLPLLSVFPLLASVALADEAVIGYAGKHKVIGHTGQDAGTAGGAGLGDTPSTAASERNGNAPATATGRGLVDTPTSTGSVHDAGLTPVRPAIPVNPASPAQKVDGTGAGTNRAPGSNVEK
jgi:hypothetical protein